MLHFVFIHILSISLSFLPYSVVNVCKLPLVTVKSFISQVRSFDKEKLTESRVKRDELVAHLQAKFSTRPEPTESSAPLGNKGANTQSGNETSPTVVPEMKVLFNTQEKWAWTTKRRYESLMMSKIKPLLTHISSKNAVEVIAVSLGSVSFKC